MRACRGCCNRFEAQRGSEIAFGGENFQHRTLGAAQLALLIRFIGFGTDREPRQRFIHQAASGAGRDVPEVTIGCVV